MNVGYCDEQLTSVDEFVSLPDAVVLGCVSEERGSEPYEVSGLIQTSRLLTVEVHSVIAGELSEDATLTLVAPGWAEIYKVEREVWDGGAIRPELGIGLCWRSTRKPTTPAACSAIKARSA
ncbi:hypothetical protein BH23ACT8_BH23ACT8_06380 [soil metagenome]